MDFSDKTLDLRLRNGINGIIPIDSILLSGTRVDRVRSNCLVVVCPDRPQLATTLSETLIPGIVGPIVEVVVARTGLDRESVRKLCSDKSGKSLRVRIKYD
jgi:hypothetical protein